MKKYSYFKVIPMLGTTIFAMQLPLNIHPQQLMLGM
jgi:hypothetical protein